MALRPGQLVLKNVRLSFPHLYVPTKSTEDGALKYRAAFLIDPETAQGKANIKLIDAEILIRAEEENGYRTELDQTLEQVYDLISNLTGNLSSLYFSHTVIQHSFLDNIENINDDAI